MKKGHGSRYTCVNLTNADTIEFRMFRGTLKLNTLIATLQMVDHICDAAIFMSDDELHDLSWSSFVSAIKEPELVQYLKERNLYIIKGNNPLTLYHFPRMSLYVYASTEQILKKGLKKGMPRMEQPFEVMLREGDILRIDRQGRYTVECFDTRNLWDGTAHFSWPYWDVYARQDEYINDLKSVAAAYGYTPHDIDVFLGYGLCPEEIEEIMCCGEV